MNHEARIPRLSIEEAKLAAEKIGVPAQMAELSVFRVLLRHPELRKAIFGLLAGLLFRGKLDARAIGNWRLFSTLLRSLEIPLEDGVAPWPPDGRKP